MKKYLTIAGWSAAVLGTFLLFFLLTPYQTDSPPTAPPLIERLEHSLNIQGALLNLEDGELTSLYLLGYEPLTKNFSAIYFAGENRFYANILAEENSLTRFYNELGPELFVDQLTDYLQLDIDFWMITRKSDLKFITDLLGGVAIPDLTGYNPTVQEQFQPRWMDGHMAAEFVSTAFKEHSTEGLRARHKDFFIGLLNNLNKLPHLHNDLRTYELLKKRLTTNLTTEELKLLGEIMLQLSPDNLLFLHAFPGEMAAHQMIRVDRIKRMLPRPLMTEIIEAQPLTSIELKILNGTSVSGLASELQQILQGYDFIDVVELGNADRHDYQTTRIIDRGDHPQSAYRVKNLLGLGKLQIEPSRQALVDVTLVAGSDILAFIDSQSENQ